MSRTRYQSTTAASSSVTVDDYHTGGNSPAWTNPAYLASASLISDMIEGGARVMKPCRHLSYDCSAQHWDWYHSAVGMPSNPSLPRHLYRGVRHTNESLGIGNTMPIGDYIPVTARSVNDHDDCLFRAYNMFVNEYRGMDGAQTIFEAGQLPGLFNIWNRRKGIASNLTNGFLNYSFGWRPVISDLVSVSQELRRLPHIVRGNLKNDEVVRHYRFNFDESVNDYVYNYVYDNGPYIWNKGGIRGRTDDKSRMIVVTIRAKKKSKLQGDGQKLLEKLGRYGLIPSIATLWSVTRLSFVIDWFYNVGGAIENLQGSLTHDISNVTCCVTDRRTRKIKFEADGGIGSYNRVTDVEQVEFIRTVPNGIPLLPQLTTPRHAMQYVLLGFIALASSSGGRKLLQTADRYERRLDRSVEKRLVRFLQRNKLLGWY